MPKIGLRVVESYQSPTSALLRVTRRGPELLGRPATTLAPAPFVALRSNDLQACHRRRHHRHLARVHRPAGCGAHGLQCGVLFALCLVSLTNLGGNDGCAHRVLVEVLPEGDIPSRVRTPRTFPPPSPLAPQHLTSPSPPTILQSCLLSDAHGHIGCFVCHLLGQGEQ